MPALAVFDLRKGLANSVDACLAGRAHNSDAQVFGHAFTFHTGFARIASHPGAGVFGHALTLDADLTGVTHHVGAGVLIRNPLEREITSGQDDLEVAEVNLLCNRSNHGVLVVA